MPTSHNAPLKSDLKWNSSVSSGMDILKFLSSMNKKCKNAHNMVKCVGDVILRSVSTILLSADSYENTENVQNSGTSNDKIFAQRTEENITLLLEEIMKYLRNYVLSVDMKERGNEAKESGRAGLSWFKAGKS